MSITISVCINHPASGIFPRVIVKSAKAVTTQAVGIVLHMFLFNVLFLLDD